MSTVLVVEDDIALRALVVLVLQREGYKVTTAVHGLDALERIGAGMPDLILLDIKMPVMSGGEFAAVYRERYAEDSRAPVIVMTAAEHAARRAQEIGANGFLAKPFVINELVRTVAKYLHREPAVGPAPADVTSS